MSGIWVCSACDGVGTWVEDFDKDFGVVTASCTRCDGRGWIKPTRRKASA